MNIKLCLFTASLLVACAAYADSPVLLTASDTLNNSSYNSGLNWQDGISPTEATTRDFMVCNGLGLRTPTGNSTYEFAASSLTIGATDFSSIGHFNLCTGSGGPKVSDLRLYAGTVRNLRNGSTQRMFGTATVYGNTDRPFVLDMLTNDQTYGPRCLIYRNVFIGAEDSCLQLAGEKGIHYFYDPKNDVASSNPDYYGSWIVSGHKDAGCVMMIASADALGGAKSVFDQQALVISNRCTLVVTNSPVTIAASSNRGIYIGQGGAIIDVAKDITFEIDVKLSGLDGVTLTKTGEGELILGGELDVPVFVAEGLLTKGSGFSQTSRGTITYGYVRMVTYDASGESSFNAGTNWKNSINPNEATDRDFLVDNGYALRTPKNNGGCTFAANSLTLGAPDFSSDGQLNVWSPKGFTINNLILYSGFINNNRNGSTEYLRGNMTVHSGKSAPFVFHTWTDDPTWGPRWFVYRATIKGDENTCLQMRGEGSHLFVDPSDGTVSANPDYLGSWVLTGQNGKGYMVLSSAASLGGAKTTFDSQSLVISNSCTLVVTNSSVSLAAASNRGVYVGVGGAFFDVGPNLTAEIATSLTTEADTMVGKIGEGTLAIGGTSTGGENSMLYVHEGEVQVTASRAFAYYRFLGGSLKVGVIADGTSEAANYGIVAANGFVADGGLSVDFDLPTTIDSAALPILTVTSSDAADTLVSQMKLVRKVRGRKITFEKRQQTLNDATVYTVFGVVETPGTELIIK